MDIEKVKKLTGDNSEKCILCYLIHQDLNLHGKLTGHPLDWGGGVTFPVDGKIRHLKLEGLTEHSISQ